MASVLVVVDNVLPDQAEQMRLARHDDVFQQLAAQYTDVGLPPASIFVPTLLSRTCRYVTCGGAALARGDPSRPKIAGETKRK
jgi:hypothetical protein